MDRGRLWIALTLLSAAASACVQPARDPAGALEPAAAGVDHCSSLSGRRFGPARIVAAMTAAPPYSVEWIGSRDAGTALKAFCRVEGAIDAAPGSHSRFELWLPESGEWNNRFLGLGAGGSLGAINTVDLAHGVNRGFAAMANDNGHRSPGRLDDNQWALRAPERITDFGYRSHHLATVAGKAIAHAYYGRAASHAYHYGCSQGGQKGMMEAQRFPEDYDGIVVGAPVYSWVDAMTAQAWGVRAVTETPRSALPVSDLRLLHDAVAKSCAREDGLVVGACRFDPADLTCTGPKTASCLLPEQVTAVQKIYDGPKTSAGRQILPGLSRSSELLWEAFYSNATPDGARGGGSWFGVYRFMMFDDPSWTLPMLDFDRDPALAKEKLGGQLDADNPNLDAFIGRGGKLLVYHGWADQQAPTQSAIDYRDAVIQRKPSADDAFRLFLVPGMAHCLASSLTSLSPPGPGAQTAVPITAENDPLTAMLQWVEKGVRPDQLVFRVQDERRGITPTIVRACASPRTARYRGTGDPRNAEAWECSL